MPGPPYNKALVLTKTAVKSFGFYRLCTGDFCHMEGCKIVEGI